MKRDMELVRKILFALEAHDSFDGVELQFTKTSAESITYHVKIMADAGLIEAVDLGTRGGAEWLPIGLTWLGHEFLDNARNDTVWRKVRAGLGKRADTMSFGVLSSLLNWVAEETAKGNIKIPFT